MGQGPRVLIDVDALRHNLRRAKQAAPASRLLAVVKANGYGHDMLWVAQALDEADGFGVARTSEGIRLRQAGIRQPITVLGGFLDQHELQASSQHRLEVVIHSPFQLQLLEQTQLDTPVTCWIKIDTGMHRLGLEPEQVQPVAQRLNSLAQVTGEIRYMSHLACADDPANPATLQQQQLFNQTVPANATTSLANSAGILAWPATHAHWNRPGIMLYGASPLLNHNSADDDLLPVMTLQASLISINSVKQGQAIGYGASWICPTDMRVGIAAIGYGDGYPRHAPPGTPILINGKIAPLIGRVSMDMIQLDLSQHPQAVIGDTLVLWGKGLPAETIAAKVGTITYELFCGITSRVQRIKTDQDFSTNGTH